MDLKQWTVNAILKEKYQKTAQYLAIYSQLGDSYSTWPPYRREETERAAGHDSFPPFLPPSCSLLFPVFPAPAKERSSCSCSCQQEKQQLWTGQKQKKKLRLPTEGGEGRRGRRELTPQQKRRRRRQAESRDSIHSIPNFCKLLLLQKKKYQLHFPLTQRVPPSLSP